MDLKGCYTALVTPFAGDEVAWDTLRDLVEKQVDAGVDGVVPVGTTGESPTLTVTEHEKVIETVIETVNGRCTVIAGTGANSTAEAIELTKHAKQAGADASLQVTPYYNKPTPEGLYRHFSTVFEEGGLPIVLYNIPGRSGVPIPVPTIERLVKNGGIAAVKEAGGSVDRVSQILSVCDVAILSGDDPLTLPMMAVGGKGVVSVASNLIPAEVTKMTHLALAGDWDAARTLHYRYYNLCKRMFIETNPIPIKAAMAMAGLLEETYRLPMCPLQPQNRETLEAELKNVGLL